MVLLDSNIFIYGGRGFIELSVLKDLEACYASITKIEVLGYQNITLAEDRKLRQILDAYTVIDLSETIIKRAIELRQDVKMSLGDAIVAATALESKLPLWTANTKDFEHIEKLKLVDPFKL